ncbi:sugar O-acetyltransferase [Vibrio parahaemolyticus]|uniref:sugar O-acetyltransferase n=1 Tax=Vibrio parahaemolyticus TaxID=670 RepID=UPI0007A0A179|nr:sugar O-acetyltransferase [Vibrio parahaemolyticus]EGQ9221188.1 sugar O-acetyltransferase [Vibrio parahaemolyticus]ELA9389198.1 sugar O-acetyltransferase [Vibrio parahaemolyticus]KYZ05127.1 galactoside O-acetyltransferase [Vibrio parahaemolyticus]MBE3690712.1 sugar O-acetyltransferase [Vibrio parahaemolyticus]MBE3807194.1 sugar O-acetyltransferase [Vibrio parahaemolyticus]
MDRQSMLHSQKIYFCTDEELAKQQTQCLEILYDYNQTRPSEGEKRGEILQRLLGAVGDNCYIEPPLRANWGRHTYLGDNVYANFNLTLVDDTYIYIGNSVMIGPNVTIATAGHPIEPDLRREVAQFNIPVHIEDNVWIGANSVVLPGVTIGENSVIGAGSVVTKDIPSNVVAVGNPCRVLREIGEHDREFYFKDRKVEGNVYSDQEEA